MSGAGGAPGGMGAMMRPTVHRLIASKRGGHKYKQQLPEQPNVWKVVRGDKVHVIAGKDKGKEGKVIRVLREEMRVIVEGVNLIKKHIKGQGPTQPGKVVTKEAPFDYSNVALVCPVKGGPTKIKMGFLEDGTKVRIAKTSGAIIPKPDFSHVTAEKPNGLEKDTEPHVVQKVTVSEEDAELHRRLRELQLAGKITSPTRLRHLAMEAEEAEYQRKKLGKIKELKWLGRQMKFAELRESMAAMEAKEGAAKAEKASK